MYGRSDCPFGRRFAGLPGGPTPGVRATIRMGRAGPPPDRVRADRDIIYYVILYYIMLCYIILYYLIYYIILLF